MRNCNDCDAAPGDHHVAGCDVERCPRCGFQQISCDCIYVINGLNVFAMSETHPDIYATGPTPEMEAKWDAEWGSRRTKWTGEWPGAAECREYGFWSVGPPWVSVPEGTPDASADLNRLYTECQWDAEQQKMVLRKA